MTAELSEIQAAMEQAAELLATRPAEQRAGWVVYLLEALDEHAQAADFEDVLRGVQESITTRLGEGTW